MFQKLEYMLENRTVSFSALTEFTFWGETLPGSWVKTMNEANFSVILTQLFAGECVCCLFPALHFITALCMSSFEGLASWCFWDAS